MQNEKYTLVFQSDLHICINDAKTHDLNEALYDDAAQYLEDIKKGLEQSPIPDYPDNNLLHNKPHWFSGKIESIIPTVAAFEGSLHCLTTVNLLDELTENEYDTLIDFIESEYATGWGNDMDYYPIPIESDPSQVLFVSFNRPAELSLLEEESYLEPSL